MSVPSDEELLAYADELLATEAATGIESQLRADASVRERLQQLLLTRDHHGPGVGDLWRQQRLSCPSRTELGLWLARVLPGDQADYITFHLETVGCAYCRAELAEMRTSLERAASTSATETRRETLFTSSVGLLGSSRTGKST